MKNMFRKVLIRFFKTVLKKLVKDHGSQDEMEIRKDPAIDYRDYWEEVISQCYLLSVKELRCHIIEEEETVLSDNEIEIRKIYET